MSADMLMMASTSSGSRYVGGQTSSGNGLRGQFVESSEDVSSRRSQMCFGGMDVNGESSTNASTGAFGIAAADGPPCLTNGDCFRLHEWTSSADRRPASLTASDCCDLDRMIRLESVNSATRRVPMHSADLHDVRQAAGYASTSAGLQPSRGDVLTDSSYFSSSMSSSSSLSSSSSASSTDGSSAGTHGFVEGALSDQLLTSPTASVAMTTGPAIGSGSVVAASSWFEVASSPSSTTAQLNQQLSKHHVDEEDLQLQHQMTTTAAAVRPSANMTECVAVPSSEHVAEIVGRQGELMMAS